MEPRRCAFAVRAARRVGVRTGVPAGLVAIALSALTVSPAAAHTEVDATVPGDGARVTAPLQQVQVTFTGPVAASGARLVLRAPDGSAVPAGGLEVAERALRLPLPEGLPTPGEYRGTWRVVSRDGHPLSGTFSFVYAPPAGPSASSGGGSGAASGTGASAATTVAAPPASRPDATASPAAVATGSTGGPAVPLALAGLTAVGVGTTVAARRRSRRRGD